MPGRAAGCLQCTLRRHTTTQPGGPPAVSTLPLCHTPLLVPFATTTTTWRGGGQGQSNSTVFSRSIAAVLCLGGAGRPEDINSGGQGTARPGGGVNGHNQPSTHPGHQPPQSAGALTCGVWAQDSRPETEHPVVRPATGSSDVKLLPSLTRFIAMEVHNIIIDVSSN